MRGLRFEVLLLHYYKISEPNSPSVKKQLGCLAGIYDYKGIGSPGDALICERARPPSCASLGR